jgi:hypothetical protein
MDPLVCPFPLSRIVLEILVLYPLNVGLGAWAYRILWPHDSDPDRALLAGAAASVLVLLLLSWGRWRRRFVVDAGGVELRRSKSRVLVRLDWGEVDEIFLLGRAAFEIRGAGRSIRLKGPYRFLGRARERCAPRLVGIRDHLQRRALADGKLVFRMPEEAWKAHLAYLGAVLILTVLTGLALAPLFRGRFSRLPVFFIFLGGSWLWGLRKRASRLGTRVTLLREGLVLKRLDGQERIAWSDYGHSEWNRKDGLDLILRSGRVLPLPPSLGNIAMLEEFLREGPPRADSGSPEAAENRTMSGNV